VAVLDRIHEELFDEQHDAQVLGPGDLRARARLLDERPERGERVAAGGKDGAVRSVEH